MSGVFLPSDMCLNAAMRCRGCTSWPPRPKIALVSEGVLAIAGIPSYCGRSALARALKSDWVTARVRAVSSERSKTLTDLADARASTNSASGNGCNALTDTTPTLRPCLLYTSDAADDLLCVDLGG